MLTFTRLLTDSGLRHWDLRGPAGLIRFETAATPGITTAAVYLHGVVAPGGAELEDCDLCGKCWPDAMGGDHAQALREDWETALCHDAVIRTQLERWYTENLAAWAAEQAPEDQDPMSRAVGYDGSLDRPAPAVINGDESRWLRNAAARRVSESDCPEGAGCADHPLGHYRGAITANPAEDIPDATLVIARLVPDLAIVTAATIAAALDEAGYEIVRKAGAR